MASEIRVNKIINRSGLSTVTFTDDGAIVSGIVSATVYTGSGANLTDLPAGNLSGTLPAISATNLTSIPAANLTGTVADARLSTVSSSKLSGALPAIDGSALTGVGASFGNSSVNTSGIITATAFVPTTSGQLSHRNVWINGEFSVAQRGTQQTSITSLSGYATGGPDRCYVVVSNHGTWTVKQGTDAPPGFQNCMEMIATTGDSSVGSNAAVRWWQRFEGQDLQRFMKGTSSAKQFALSFYIKAKQTGTYAFELLDYDNSNRGITRTYTVDAAETWEYKTIIFPGDTTGAFDNDNALSLAAEFWLVAGSDNTSGGADASWHAYANNKRAAGHTANAGASNNDYVRITGVQLEVGPVSTPYEHRSFAEELIRCHRYFYKSDGEADSGFRYWAHPYSDGSAARRVTIMHPQTMRVAPTFTNLLHDQDTGASNTNGSALYNSNQQWTFAKDAESTGGWVRIERWWASAEL